MGKTSKKYFDLEFKKEIWKQIQDEIEKAENQNNLEKILSKFLSSAEMLIIEKRLGVMYLLKNGSTYRKIAEVVDVSPRTISFIKKGLKRGVSKKKEYSAVIWQPAKIKNKSSRFPTYRGRGRWRFLNN